MRVTEIFRSIQGEGPSAGRPAIFVRLSGCNLKCKRCDTKYSWSSSTEMSCEEIVRCVSSLQRWRHRELVVITGGEPFIQEVELRLLLSCLSSLWVDVEIETNGTIIPRKAVDAFLIVSPKLRYFSGKEIDLDLLTHIVLSHRCAVKIVCRGEIDHQEVFDVVKRIRSVDVKTPIYLMPDGKTFRNWRKVLQFANKYGLCFSPRLQLFGVK